MDIVSLYKKRITSDFIIRNIFNGEIPSPSDITDYLKTINLDELPLVNQFTKEFTGYSKAQDYNELLERTAIDLNVAYDAIQEIAKDNKELSNYILSKLDGYFIRLKQLNSRAENLLLTQYDTDGFFDFFYDDFDKIDNVDFNYTDAFIDTELNQVRVSKRISNDLVKIDPTDIKFIPTSSPNIYSTYEVSGFGLSNLVDATPKPWQYKFVTKSIINKVEGTIFVTFNRLISGVHRIEIDDIASDGAQVVGFEYSSDGLNYKPFNTGAPFYATSGKNIAIEFDVVDDLKTIKIIIEKRAFSYYEKGGKPVYTMSLDEIRVYASGEITLPGTTIYQSTPISIDSKKILKCSLEVCHDCPAGASITYYVKGNNSDFVPISGINENEKKFPTIIDFDKNQSLLFTGYLGYINKDNAAFENSKSNIDYRVIDGFLPADKDVSSMYVWKGVLKTLDYTGGNGFTTNGSGWLTNGSTYSCFFFVDEKEGMKIDLKNTTAILDNKQVTGQVFIPYGVHSFETSSTNWAQITSVAGNVVTDPIPGVGLNHKYLIEGCVNPPPAITNTIYLKRTTPRLIASRRASYIPKYDFFYGGLFNKNDVFTIAWVSNNEADPVQKIIVNNDGEDYSSNNSSTLVEYKSGSVLNATFASSVVLRAILTSSEEGATPSIDSVLLKLGTVE